MKSFLSTCLEPEYKGSTKGDTASAYAVTDDSLNLIDFDFIEEEKLTGSRHCKGGQLGLSRRVLKTALLCKDKSLRINDINEQNMDHHASHVLSAYVQSPFRHCVALAVDNSGASNRSSDRVSIAAYEIIDGKESLLFSFGVKESLGEIYSAISSMIMGASECDGKTMGLAEYGNDFNDLDIYKFVEVNSSLVAEHSKDYRSYVYNSYTTGKNVMRYANLASRLQQTFENRMFELCKYIAKVKPDLPLIIAGGCALNCTFTGKLLRSKIFPDVFVPAVCEDHGLAISNVFSQIGFHQKTKLVKYSKLHAIDSNVQVDLIKYFTQTTLEEIANLLKQGEIIAWVEGGVECGPRALCHRSLLADPSIPYMKYRLNEVKSREYWRPLAPVVLDCVFEDMFNVKPSQPHEIMQATEIVSSEYRVKYPGVVSIAGTARPQVIYEDQGLLYQIMSEFDLPVLFNTSLNGKGQSIIMYLDDAMHFVNAQQNVSLVYVRNNKLFLYK